MTSQTFGASITRESNRSCSGSTQSTNGDKREGEGTTKGTERTKEFSFVRSVPFVVPSSFLRINRDLHVHIRPAALKARPAVACPVIGLQAQDVFARCAELCGCGCFAFGFHTWPRIFECDDCRTAKLTP